MRNLLLGLSILSATITFEANAQHGHETATVTKTPPKIVFRKLISNAKIDNQEVKMVLVTFGPGEASSAHRHPIPTIAYVLEGEISSTFEGETNVYKTGETFWEEPDGLHSESRNTSKTSPAKLLVVYIGDKEQPFIIPEKK